MKNTNKKESSMEQKIYTVLLGFGLVALAAVPVLYGVRTQQTNEFAKQDIQPGEQNPVTGPVSPTNLGETDTKESKEEKKEETTENLLTNQEEAVDSMAKAAGYNGKDKFAWPVTGNVIIPYSMDTTVYFETLDQYQCNPALYIKGDQGTEVKAVFGGTVSNVAKNSRYGSQITIDMGNGYKMLYGQLEEIPYKKGDVVEKGSVIGKIAEPTEYYSLEGSHLYMKMTFQGKAVNPTDYLEP